MGSCCSKGEDIVDYGPDTQPGQPDSSGVDALPAAAGDEALVDPVTPDTLDASVAGTTLEHIADREDLSNETETMFLRLSHVSMKLMNTGRQRHSSARVVPRTTSVSSTGATSSPITIKKSNSCSTIFSDDSTVTLPNLKSTLKCASLAVFYMIKGRDRTRAPRTMDIFDEKLHPLSRDEVPAHYADFTPDHKVIYKFIKTLFHAAQLTAECAIITIIYLERLLHYAELDLHPCNWKRILLGAILLASKVWDDQAVWNVDYCQILRDITVEDMNELERVYLEQIQFNINVASSMYAKYYFDLRTLAEENAISLPNEYQPLSKERAKKIEALSFAADTKLGGKMHRSQSLEPLSPKNVVIIS